jgi:peptidoglycan/LPS O-acetylase OafA/YrhL
MATAQLTDHPKLKFHSEIAGLRAIAVISVVMFHLKVSGFDGGFVGVDIFFVISGYLITRNILADIDRACFSFGQFYVRRTKRIYPALIFTVTATFVAGALWCSPEMFLDLAKECTHALLSIANIQYWRESRHYFALSSNELALLHFWSLSLEEQFYLFWPILVVVAHRFDRSFEAIAVLGIVSLAAAVVVARTDSSAVFFLMPFRIHEFAIGAAVIWVERKFYPTRLTAEIAFASGLICIAASVWLFRSGMVHLEMLILLPCLGAGAIIWAGKSPRSLALIANPVMTGIGAISYSLYLCHWPIIFFARFIFGDEAADSVPAIYFELASMIGVASATYVLIERQFIQSHDIRPAGFWMNTAAFGAVVLPLAAVTHATFLWKGFPSRLPQAQAELAYLQDFPEGREMLSLDGPLRFELVGDSFAQQYTTGLASLAKRLSMKFEIHAGANCPLLLGVELKSFRRQECNQTRNEVLRRLSETDLPIILALRWDLYDDEAIEDKFDPAATPTSGKKTYAKLQTALERTLETLTANGRHLLLVGAQVEAGCEIDRPRLLQGPLRHRPVPPCPTMRDVDARANASVDSMLAGIASKWGDQVRLFRPIDYFCDTMCPVVKDGIWLYFDSSHFSVAGSTYFVDRSQEVFREFLIANEWPPSRAKGP